MTAGSGGAASGFVGLGRDKVVLPEELEPVDAYRDRVLSSLSPLEPIALGLTDVLGCILADDVTADTDLPPFVNSAMDGYAVVASDVAAASQSSPVTLEVVGEVVAGTDAASLRVEPGVTVRIMTGAPLPEGADAVVPVELTRESGGDVEVFKSHSEGHNVRSAGEDVRVGQRVLRAGRRLRPGDIALLAALGRTDVLCHPRPRVVMMSTGSELVKAEHSIGPGQIRDSNGPMLRALVRQAGADAYWSGIVGDDRANLIEAIDSNLGHADMVVTTGGVSAGTADHVRDVLSMLGDVSITKVAMKPGMPQLFGTVRGVPVFGLPGNPVSSFVSFEVFVRPALRVLQGRRDRFRPTVTARLSEDVRAPEGKRLYLRVKLAQKEGRWVAAPAGGQGSHQLSTLVATDGLAEIPAKRTVLPAGERVRVHLLVDPS